MFRNHLTITLVVLSLAFLLPFSLSIIIHEDKMASQSTSVMKDPFTFTETFPVSNGGNEVAIARTGDMLSRSASPQLVSAQMSLEDTYSSHGLSAKANNDTRKSLVAAENTGESLGTIMDGWSATGPLDGYISYSLSSFTRDNDGTGSQMITAEKAGVGISRHFEGLDSTKSYRADAWVYVERGGAGLVMGDKSYSTENTGKWMILVSDSIIGVSDLNLAITTSKEDTILFVDSVVMREEGVPSPTPTHDPNTTPIPYGDDCIGCKGTTWEHEKSQGLPDGINSSTETTVRPILYLTSDYLNQNPPYPHALLSDFNIALFSVKNWYQQQIAGFDIDIINPIEIHYDQNYSYTLCRTTHDEGYCDDELLGRVEHWAALETIRRPMPVVFVPEIIKFWGACYGGNEQFLVVTWGAYISGNGFTHVIAHELGHAMNIGHSYNNSAMNAGDGTPISTRVLFNTGYFPEKKVVCESSLNRNQTYCSQYVSKNPINHLILPDANIFFRQNNGSEIPSSCLDFGLRLHHEDSSNYDGNITNTNGLFNIHNLSVFVDGSTYRGDGINNGHRLGYGFPNNLPLVFINTNGNTFSVCEEYGMGCQIVYQNGTVLSATFDKLELNLSQCNNPERSPTPTPTLTPTPTIPCTRRSTDYTYQRALVDCPICLRSTKEGSFYPHAVYQDPRPFDFVDSSCTTSLSCVSVCGALLPTPTPCLPNGSSCQVGSNCCSGYCNGVCLGSTATPTPTPTTRPPTVTLIPTYTPTPPACNSNPEGVMMVGESGTYGCTTPTITPTATPTPTIEIITCPVGTGPCIQSNCSPPKVNLGFCTLASGNIGHCCATPTRTPTRTPTTRPNTPTNTPPPPQGNIMGSLNCQYNPSAMNGQQMILYRNGGEIASATISYTGGQGGQQGTFAFNHNTNFSDGLYALRPGSGSQNCGGGSHMWVCPNTGGTYECIKNNGGSIVAKRKSTDCNDAGNPASWHWCSPVPPSDSDTNCWMTIDQTSISVVATDCDAGGPDPSNTPPPSLPDLRPATINAPSSATAGQSVSGTLTIFNDGSGGGNTGSIVVRSVLPTPPYPVVCTNALFTLPSRSMGGNTQTTIPFSFTAPSTPGTYYLGPVVDCANSTVESNENNNAMQWASILTVNAAPTPTPTAACNKVAITNFTAGRMNQLPSPVIASAQTVSLTYHKVSGSVNPTELNLVAVIDNGNLNIVATDWMNPQNGNYSFVQSNTWANPLANSTLNKYKLDVIWPEGTNVCADSPSSVYSNVVNVPLYNPHGDALVQGLPSYTNKCRLFGWARDQDKDKRSTNGGVPIAVHIYKNGRFDGGGQFLTSATANIVRGDLPFGQGYQNHGYDIDFYTAMTPATLLALTGTTPVPLYVYGINHTGTAGGNVLISPLDSSGVSTLSIRCAWNGPTLTPTRTPTSTPTRTPTQGAVTSTPTRTPTMTPTRTPTPAGIAVSCVNPTVIPAQVLTPGQQVDYHGATYTTGWSPEVKHKSMPNAQTTPAAPMGTCYGIGCIFTPTITPGHTRLFVGVNLKKIISITPYFCDWKSTWVPHAPAGYGSCVNNCNKVLSIQ